VLLPRLLLTAEKNADHVFPFISLPFSRLTHISKTEQISGDKKRRRFLRALSHDLTGD
jgi:hypothetical protein